MQGIFFFFWCLLYGLPSRNGIGNLMSLDHSQPASAPFGDTFGKKWTSIVARKEIWIFRTETFLCGLKWGWVFKEHLLAPKWNHMGCFVCIFSHLKCIKIHTNVIVLPALNPLQTAPPSGWPPFIVCVTSLFYGLENKDKCALPFLRTWNANQTVIVKTFEYICEYVKWRKLWIFLPSGNRGKRNRTNEATLGW